MTRAKISEYSATAGDNTDVNGINIAEGCPPSSMNNMGREIMAALKRFQVGSDGDGVTVGGSLVVSGSTSVNTFNVDVISEKTSAAGVTVDGVLLKDSQVSTDQINEKTSATGVTIDGVLLKDSGVVTGAGTVSAPVYSTTGDLNTGIFFPAADTIAFAEGGAEAMRIDSSGNVGIGTTSPGSYGQLALYKASSNVEAAVVTDGANYATYRVQNSSQRYSMQIRTDVSNAFVIRDETNAANRFVIDTSGNLLVGTTTRSNDEKVTIYQVANAVGISVRSNSGPVSGNYESADDGRNAYWTFGRDNSSTGNFVFYYNGNSRGSINLTTGAYSATSDARVKKNIENLGYGLNEVLALRPVTYLMNHESDDSKKHLGFIAQEVKAVMDEAVDDLKDKETQIYGLDKSGLVPVLVKAIQELKAINDTQASRIETLEAKVAALEAQPTSSGE